jgi:hypothetical protein
MLRRSRGGDDRHNESSSNSLNYEVFEEECLETLSDDGVEILYSMQQQEYEEEEIIEYEEEEVLDATPALPGISEGNEEEVDDDDEEEVIEEEEEEVEEYEEVEVNMNGSHSVFSGTEFLEEEVLDDDDDQAEEEVLEEVEYMEQTFRDGSEDGSIRELPLEQSFRSNSNHTTAAKYDASIEDEGFENPEDDDDGASAEELTEAIEYVLRQERAVSKFILTEAQAAKMAHLPIPVMKIIVDHLEVCDNEATPIDWDFLLKIVLPFCENEAD